MTDVPTRAEIDAMITKLVSRPLGGDPRDPLVKDRETLVAIRDDADHATDDLADARKRLSLISFMAQSAIDRLDGKPGHF